MSAALYTDLSRYYDLMCSSIDYREQSAHVDRVNQLLGNGGKRHLDLGCGTGPHVRHFVDAGYRSSGLDIHQPMLDIAHQRCPEAAFMQGDMGLFTVAEPFDLVTCFLYSIHYTQTIDRLASCIASVHAALGENGAFCFNAVDRTTIANTTGVRHDVEQEGCQLVFRSTWRYPGHGDSQQLLVRIEKSEAGATAVWEDQHAMVAVDFQRLQALLAPLFDIHVLEHVYDRIEPWQGTSGNALFVCIKR